MFTRCPIDCIPHCWMISGLVEALNAECDGFSRRESIPVEFKPRDVPREVRPETALCLFRVAQESLRNVARHAGASCSRSFAAES